MNLRIPERCKVETTIDGGSTTTIDILYRFKTGTKAGKLFCFIKMQNRECCVGAFLDANRDRDRERKRKRTSRRMNLGVGRSVNIQSSDSKV